MEGAVGSQERERSFARFSAANWLATYLAVTGALLAAGGSWRAALAHAAGIGVLFVTPRRIAPLVALIAAPLLYAEVPMLIAATGVSFHDAAVQRWETLLFGTQPSRTFAIAAPWMPLSELLHAGYLAYYPLIFVPPLLLLIRREERAFEKTVLALVATFTVCWLVFAVFPAAGPRYLWGPADAPDGPFRRAAIAILAAGSSRGAAFPSSHMAVAVAQAVMAWRHQSRTVAWICVVIAALIGVGAVYGGFHYAVDMIAGALLGAAVSAAVCRSR
jgi:membrane-associated phospholipid phosphatase